MASDTHVDATSASGAADNHRALVAVNSRFNQLPALPWSHAAVPVRPEILTARPTPFELLHALRRRWLLAVGLGMVLGGLLAGVVWLVVPVRYEAVSLIKVTKNTSPLLEKVGSLEDFETYKRTQQQLIKSNFVLSRAVRKPEMAKLALIQEHKDDPVNYLENSLIIDYPGDAEVLRVALKGDRREELPVIVNAVVDSYMSEIVNAERDARLRQRDTLDRNYGKNREEIRKKFNAYHQLAKQLGTIGSETAQIKKRIAVDHLNTILVSRNRVEEQIRDQELKIVIYKRQLEAPAENQVPDYILDGELSKDPTIAQAMAEVPRVRRAIKEEESRHANPAKASSIQRLKRQLVDLEEQIEERKNELRPQISEQFAGRGIAGSNIALPLLEAEREELGKRLEFLNASAARQMDEVQKLEQNSSELDARKAELEELQTITSRMGLQLKLWNLELEADPRIRVADQASKPQTNDAMRKYIGVGVAGLLGFGLVLFGIAWVEFQSRRLNTTGEVKEGLGLQVMGELPPLSGRTWRKIRAGGVQGSRLEAALTESIDSIRTSLIHTTSVDSPRVVMVTSADAQEGKTTVASQLAASLARSGRRTLLVDGDLRSPAAHRVFELPLEPGLCEVLRNDVEHTAAIQPTRSANLWLLSAGRCDARSVQALSHAHLSSLFAALKTEFDFVIIDSGPVLKVADPLLLGQHVDAAVLSVLRDVSRVPQLYEACDRMQSVGVTVLGIVVNGVSTRSHNNYGLALLESDAKSAS